jgi:AcrR family transcriptional regulator
VTVIEGKRARNQAVRRKRVIDAAMSLASEGGYEAVQMRDVAERADVALGTLYRYFPSKDQLLVAALAEWAGALLSRLSQKPPRGDSPSDRLVDVLRRACRALEREPRVTAAMVGALSAPDPSVADRKREAFVTLNSIITLALDHTGDDDTRVGVVRVLGSVWFAGMIAFSTGMAGPGQMADDLEEATRLLLRE